VTTWLRQPTTAPHPTNVVSIPIPAYILLTRTSVDSMLLIDYYFIFAIVLLIDSYSDLQVSLLHHRTSMSDELETGNGGKRQREDLDEESDQPPSKSIGK
jgi:hypothetical protein